MVINGYRLRDFEGSYDDPVREVGYLVAHEMSHIFQKRLEGDDELEPSWLREATAVYVGNQVIPDIPSVLALDHGLFEGTNYSLPLDHFVFNQADVVPGRGYAMWRFFQWYRLEFGEDSSRRLLAGGLLDALRAGGFRSLIGDASGLPVGDLPPELTTPGPAPAPTPGPAPGGSGPGLVGLGDFGWQSWRLTGGGGRTNCYMISRNTRAHGGVFRLEGTASITSRNGRNWTLEAKLTTKAELEEQGDVLAEGHKTTIETTGTYEATFSTENPRLNFTQRTLRGKLCRTVPTQTPAEQCKALSNTQLRHYNQQQIKISQATRTKFKIEATAPGLQPTTTTIPKHNTQRR